jgi:hypothetical protein
MAVRERRQLEEQGWKQYLDDWKNVERAGEGNMSAMSGSGTEMSNIRDVVLK